MGEPRQYCLKWNNHPKNVATVFDRLRAEELFVDVTLATSDRQVIRAHRVLLSAGSAYLERLLAVTPSEHPTVVLANVRYKELKLLVDFMYCGEVAVGQAQFPALMEAANWLQVRGLCTEEVKDPGQEQEGEKTPELTVTANSGRKRHHSLESEEEEEEEQQILGPEEEDQEDPVNQAKQMYGPIQGVANAVWMMGRVAKQEEDEGMEQEEPEEEQGGGLVPDLVTVQGRPPTALKQPLLSPSLLNEQLLQAMQLCSNPYLSPMAVQQRSNLDLHSPTSYTTYPTSPFKPSSHGPPSPSKSLLTPAAPVRRYKQYTEDSLQAALREIVGGQSINRSSMKHSIPARTLRDWMKRLNIKSVFTHAHRERGGGSGGEETATSPEPLTFSSPEPITFSPDLSPSNLSMIAAGFMRQEQDQPEEGEESGLRIDEGGLTPVHQIAQAAS